MEQLDARLPRGNGKTLSRLKLLAGRIRDMEIRVDDYDSYKIAFIAYTKSNGMKTLRTYLSESELRRVIVTTANDFRKDTIGVRLFDIVMDPVILSIGEYEP